MSEHQELAPTIAIEARFAVALLRCLVKLLNPEVVGIAALTAANEIGMPRATALRLTARLMAQARPPREGVPRTQGDSLSFIRNLMKEARKREKKP